MNPLLQSVEYFGSLEFMERADVSQYLVELCLCEMYGLEFISLNKKGGRGESNGRESGPRIPPVIFWIIRIKI